ncbi:hypothetical protein EBZ80_24570 [bacterium]|nr:hypothetical protein [bacterium]
MFRDFHVRGPAAYYECLLAGRRIHFFADIHAGIERCPRRVKTIAFEDFLGALFRANPETRFRVFLEIQAFHLMQEGGVRKYVDYASASNDLCVVRCYKRFKHCFVGGRTGCRHANAVFCGVDVRLAGIRRKIGAVQKLVILLKPLMEGGEPLRPDAEKKIRRIQRHLRFPTREILDFLEIPIPFSRPVRNNLRSRFELRVRACVEALGAAVMGDGSLRADDPAVVIVWNAALMLGGLLVDFHTVFSILALPADEIPIVVLGFSHLQNIFEILRRTSDLGFEVVRTTNADPPAFRCLPCGSVMEGLAGS